ncbi:MAG: hypothetical protein KDA84_03370, partial [Planctomycetaceae bacterium]|nr:hypothetical protein [Planctomycetaceae bacterium]
MGIAVRFSRLSKLIDFLEWMANSQSIFRWEDPLEFYLYKQKRKGRRKGAASYDAWFWFPDMSTKDNYGTRQLEVLGIAEGTSPGATMTNPAEWFSLQKTSLDKKLDPEKYKKYSRDELLRSFALNRTLNQPSTGVCDLLLTVYGEDAESRFSDVFHSVSKNPDYPSRITFLEPESESSLDRPRILVELERADPRFHWTLWLHSQNRDAPQQTPLIRLFRKMMGGTHSEYYLEWGWDYPLRSLPTLDLDSTDSRMLLLSAVNPDRRVSRALWTRLTSGTGDVQLVSENTDQNIFQVDLVDAVAPVVVEPSMHHPDYRVEPRLEAFTAERRSRLESLDRQIQATRQNLFQLQAKRQSVSGMLRERFRVVLRFAQPHPADGELPRLVESFQQFLLLSRQELDRFRYVFEECPD